MNDHHYGVVVGINCYPELGDLKSAVGDAKRFAEWLGREDGGGVEDDHLELITFDDDDVSDDRSEARPQKREVHKALETFGLKVSYTEFGHWRDRVVWPDEDEEEQPARPALTVVPNARGSTGVN